MITTQELTRHLHNFLLYSVITLRVLFVTPCQLAAALAGSSHDFRDGGTGFSISGVTELCSTCHVPHKPVLNVPLWAHQLTTSVFYLYNTNTNYSSPNSGAYDSSPSNIAGGESKLCLSCHDGTVAIAGSVYMTQSSSKWILWDDGAKSGGGTSIDLSLGMKGSHPIAVNYAMARTNQPDNYKDISSDPDVKLDGGKVQCTSCHNPHYKFPKMLVKSNVDSNLCQTCHNK